MSRLSDILVKVRDSLSDQRKERWSDERLIRLADEGQKDLARHSKLLRGLTEFALEIGKYEYDLPEDLWLINRAASEGCRVTFTSYDKMDELVKKRALSTDIQESNYRYKGYMSTDFDFVRYCWEQDEGNSVETLIYDNRESDKLRVYPIPNGDIADTNYTFENAGPIEFVGDELYGVATSIDNYTLDSVFGVITSLYDPSIDKEVFEDVFGVTTDISESVKAVTLWYVRTPETLTSVDDELELPRLYDTALQYYIIGNAYLDDNNAGFRQKGTDNLAMYDRELELAKTSNARDNVNAVSTTTTTYRGAFE